MKSDYSNVCQRLVGHKPGATPESNQRRYYNRASLLLTVVFVTECVSATVFAYDNSYMTGIGYALVIWAAWFFTITVFLMPFRDSSEFRVAPRRLLFDALVSAGLMIVAFSMIFRFLGISQGPDAPPARPLDALYFSIVTFSTLGYGDFTPSPPARMFAAIEAIIGNLHLGFVVGSVMAAIGRSHDPSPPTRRVSPSRGRRWRRQRRSKRLPGSRTGFY